MASSTGSSQSSEICGVEAHNLPLGHLVDGIDVIQPFASILVALMHGVDAQVSGRALRLRFASFADGDRRGPRGLVAGIAFAIACRVAQPVQVRHRNRPPAAGRQLCWYSLYSRSRMRRVAGPLRFPCALST